MNINIRVNSIDYLRGLLALCIVIYHYLSWTNNINVNSNQNLFRIAIYGVSVFFIISGFSLVIAYKNINFLYINNIVEYFRRRIARIYPLFWLVIFLSIVIGYRNVNEIKEFLIQCSISFAFFGVNGLTPGAWSIGIEIIFYVLFPFLMLFSYYLYNFRKNIFLILYILLIGIFLYISMSYNNYTENMGSRYFKEYVSHFYNHIYFFLFGMLIAFFYKELVECDFLKKYYILFILIGIIILFLPNINTSEYYHIINGLWRLLFSFTSFVIFIAFIFITIENKILSFFGKISYTIYLTHPLSFFIFTKYIKIDNFFILLIAYIFSILFATIIYYFYEKPFQKLINNLRIY